MTNGVDTVSRPLLTVNCVVFSLRGGGLDAALVQRRSEPFAGRWALPGGFVHDGETLGAAAARALERQTGISDVHLEQFQAFADPGRDPRGHSATVGYLALVDQGTHVLSVGQDVEAAAWIPLKDLPELAFDHNVIATYAAHRLRAFVDDVTIGSAVLPPQFTVSDLRVLYTQVFAETIDEWDFRRKVLALGLTPRVGPPLRSGESRINGT